MADDNPNAFKHAFDAVAVARIADHFADADATFDRERFVAHAIDGLDALELKARVAHIAAALRQVLPHDVEEALACVRAALPPAIVGETEVAAKMYVWPLCHFVEAYAVEVPDAALPTLHALTKRFSAEFAIRPFLIQHPEATFAALRSWVDDPDVHVRRLVSEGTRPLLPWGQRLDALRTDPSPTLPLLEALRADPSAYVRRSVANHLNDIAKDHPALVVDTCAAWWEERPSDPDRQSLVKRALRTLVKRGDPAALAVLGFGPPSVDVPPLVLSSRRVAVGDALTFSTVIASTAEDEQRLLVDYVIHFQKKNGTTSPKVFKGGELTLSAGDARSFERTQSFREVTTRRLYSGRHGVQLQINGVEQGEPEWFEVCGAV